MNLIEYSAYQHSDALLAQLNKLVIKSTTCYD
ncbi:hypothetical protein F442_09740 [Phytophthora nicotianae P10297]|uniref:Uncharacterized protein n=4 Tax=Phytophthora nicotianae TaxID=4792 RepID=V9F2C1_PHYNI|nr:hypothetical protein F443_09836 [Phytophthora nicotianae P1569]ETM45454.1 hypothetical protein L914_09507 [Phytophthora nicotianae]ETO74302.1 hypothetical protein F444_09930 [Phytophthora nicotianae P1976]ETP43542.1 hypothetical protein F442_09740 [Phytophthora nicotianae P10297]